ncbi:VOC family protein [Rasiella sp. SM2506]|uniref:VOC family protein n=1 Tax=Rasiella sp. SM2506 TaxID=3423914 RepID=UPI003D7B7F7B
MGTLGSKQKTKKIKNYVNWFEIPVLNLKRAVAFYNHIYNIQMEMTEMNEYAMAFFPADNGIGGALVMGPGSVPSETGSLIYLNGGEDLQILVNKVEIAGGRVILEKTKIDDDSGYFALFIDTEGNKLALHSKK